VLKQHNQDAERLFLKPDSYAVLAQLASAKIQFEDPKPEPPAKMMAFLHGEVDLRAKAVYHRAELLELLAGTISCKRSVAWQLPGDPHSLGKELPVH